MQALIALMESGRYADAEALARTLLAQQSDWGLAWKALGVCLRVQRKEALEALRRAAELLPEDAEAQGNYANALADARRYPEAVAAYRRSIAIEPGRATSHNDLGLALRALGAFAEAEASHRRACELQPEFAVAHDNLGKLLRAGGSAAAAVAAHRRAIELQPLFPEAYNNLGNALLGLGAVAEAAQSYRTALAQWPDFAEAHSNLGNVLRQLGRLPEAIEHYSRAVALKPEFAAAYSNLSDALRDLGQLDAALASSRQALRLAPDKAGSYNSLGNVLMDLGQLAEAEASYRKALGLDREFAAAQGNLALVLRARQRPAEAAAACARALEIEPHSAAMMTLLAELHADEGRFAEAERLYERAIAIAPEFAEAWAGIAHVRKMTAADADWYAAALGLIAKNPPAREEIHLRFAAGKYLDDIRAFDQAFVHFQRANELAKRFGAAYDSAAQERLTAELIAGEGAGSGAVGRASPSQKPVFIVGMPRSGTTLAEQILAAHPAGFGAGERDFWESAQARGDRDAYRLAGDYLALIDGLAPHAERVVDKMPQNFLHLGLIHAAFPQARIVHMRRNPLDTCLSIYFQHFKSAHAYSHDLADLVHYYRQYEQLMRHWRRVLPPGVLLEIVYEDLVAEPEAEARRLVEFVGLPWNPACLDFHRAAHRVMTASKWQVRQKINTRSVARWRNYEKYLGPLASLGAAGESSGGGA
jgi:tetratricopeptide (TPR) repeat protein